MLDVVCVYFKTFQAPFILSPVLDDEDSNNITAGSIVTVTVTLTRKRMVVRNDGIRLNTDIIVSSQRNFCE